MTLKLEENWSIQNISDLQIFFTVRLICTFHSWNLKGESFGIWIAMKSHEQNNLYAYILEFNMKLHPDDNTYQQENLQTHPDFQFYL